MFFKRIRKSAGLVIATLAFLTVSSPTEVLASVPYGSTYSFYNADGGYTVTKPSGIFAIDKNATEDNDFFTYYESSVQDAIDWMGNNDIVMLNDDIRINIKHEYDYDVDIDFDTCTEDEIFDMAEELAKTVYYGNEGCEVENYDACMSDSGIIFVYAVISWPEEDAHAIRYVNYRADNYTFTADLIFYSGDDATREYAGNMIGEVLQSLEFDSQGASLQAAPATVVDMPEADETTIVDEEDTEDKEIPDDEEGRKEKKSKKKSQDDDDIFNIDDMGDAKEKKGGSFMSSNSLGLIIGIIAVAVIALIAVIIIIAVSSSNKKKKAAQPMQGQVYPGKPGFNPNVQQGYRPNMPQQGGQYVPNAQNVTQAPRPQANPYAPANGYGFNSTDDERTVMPGRQFRMAPAPAPVPAPAPTPVPAPVPTPAPVNVAEPLPMPETVKASEPLPMPEPVKAEEPVIEPVKVEEPVVENVAKAPVVEEVTPINEMEVKVPEIEASLPESAPEVAEPVVEEPKQELNGEETVRFDFAAVDSPETPSAPQNEAPVSPYAPKPAQPVTPPVSQPQNTHKFCTNCGNKLMATAAFCTNCGTKLN